MTIDGDTEPNELCIAFGYNDSNSVMLLIPAKVMTITAQTLTPA
jgi:hypothetical protein